MKIHTTMLAPSFLAIAAMLAPAPLLAEQAPAPAPAPAPAQQRPNVLVWMMDDVGFAQLSSYGGLVETPNIDRVAAMGLRYTNYRTAPICSAARASFLTGRMPHTVHIGGHATAALPFPGYDARIPAEDGTVAANLKADGYLTLALGKWDHLPGEEGSPVGPFTYWPSGQGFDRFYGFLTADTDNWEPTLIEGNRPVPRPQSKGYHLSADLADQAIAMIGERDATSPKRPFFMYWATGAAHAPHHAPADWIAKYKGKFDQGWDKARAEILKRQIAAGIVPKGTKLGAPPEGMPGWDSLSPEARKLYAHQMEVFAASLSYADHEFGRILDKLEATGQLDNTMIVITSDNGASAEGGPTGLFNESAVTGAEPLSVADNMKMYDDWGGPKTYPHYAYGWALAGDTPFRYYKQTTFEGGTHVPLVVAWPGGIAARNELRRDFVDVEDVAPTILEATGTGLATTINDVPQAPMQGVSFTTSFTVPGSERDGRAQYVELYGNKGFWWKGWSLVTNHRFRTWDWKTSPTFDEPWELYDLVKDPGQNTDLAKKNPELVAEMGRMFIEQASRDNVFPQHNLSDSLAGSIKTAQRIFAGHGGKWRYDSPVGNVPTAIAPPITSRNFTFSARLDLPREGVTGPVFAQGGQMGGIALYLENGKPVFVINRLDTVESRVAASEALPLGASEVGMALTRGDRGDDGLTAYHVVITSSGRVLADQTIRTSIPFFYGIPDTFGVGVDAGSTVLPGFPNGGSLPAGITGAVFDFNGQPAAAHAHGH